MDFIEYFMRKRPRDSQKEPNSLEGVVGRKYEIRLRVRPIRGSLFVRALLPENRRRRSHRCDNAPRSVRTTRELVDGHAPVFGVWRRLRRGRRGKSTRRERVINGRHRAVSVGLRQIRTIDRNRPRFNCRRRAWPGDAVRQWKRSDRPITTTPLSGIAVRRCGRGWGNMFVTIHFYACNVCVYTYMFGVGRNRENGLSYCAHDGRLYDARHVRKTVSKSYLCFLKRFSSHMRPSEYVLDVGIVSKTFCFRRNYRPVHRAFGNSMLCRRFESIPSAIIDRAFLASHSRVVSTPTKFRWQRRFKNIFSLTLETNQSEQ